jgi:methionine synthase II (cobalamin-independent)
MTTKILLALTGIHPRSQKTIQTTQDWERQRVSDASLRLQFDEDVEALVRLQESLSFDYVSDGQLTTHWQDLLTPITSCAKGVKKGPLVRWFNTNTFYYVPVVDGPLSVDGARLAREVTTASVRSPSKVVIVDPLTFAECSEDKHYGSRENLIFGYCDGILSPLLRALEKAGVSYVQFSAPSLVARFRGEKWSSQQLSPVAEGLKSALKGARIRSGYQTFFGDAEPYFSFLLDSIPTDDIGFDLTETDGSSIAQTNKGIIAGVADARSSYVEEPPELVGRLGDLPNKTETLTLAPSSDLRYVPRAVADEKMKNLARARKEFS